MPPDSATGVVGMSPQIVAGILGAAAVILGGILNYLVSRRALSRSGARLLADLELLERARALKLEQNLIDAIEARVRSSVEKHTNGSRHREQRTAQQNDTSSPAGVEDHRR